MGTPLLAAAHFAFGQLKNKKIIQQRITQHSETKMYGTGIFKFLKIDRQKRPKLPVDGLFGGISQFLTKILYATSMFGTERNYVPVLSSID